MTDNLSQLVRGAHAAMDDAWQRLLAENDHRRDTGLEWVEIACRPGCAGCCTFLADCKTAEAEVIASVVEHAASATRARWLQRLHDWEAAFYAWAADDLPPDPRTAWDAHLLWRSRWQVRRAACPFLDLEDHLCTIYEDRPHVCRGCHAGYPLAGDDQSRPPPDGCFTRQESVDRGEIQRQRSICNDTNIAFGEHLNEVLAGAGLTSKTGLLVLTVLEAGRRAYRWPRLPAAGPVPVLERSLPWRAE